MQTTKHNSSTNTKSLQTTLNLPHPTFNTATMSMTAPFNPTTLISYANPKTPLLNHRFCLRSFSLTKLLLSGGLLVPVAPTLSVKCSSTSNNNISSEKREMARLKDMLSGMVDKRVEELLNREENRALLNDLEKATQRVELAKRELAEIQRQEIEAKQLRNYISQLETRTSEIAECQREILEARAMVEKAERSLMTDGEATAEQINQNEERLESVKAALISAVVGSIARLPISLTRVSSISDLVLPLAVTFVSCALFGVTFRYAVRRDPDNFQLKSGTCAAFGFVKGLATLESGPPLELETASLFSHAVAGATCVSENLLIFFFAAVGLDFCIKLRILSPFPIVRVVSQTSVK